MERLPKTSKASNGISHERLKKWEQSVQADSLRTKSIPVKGLAGEEEKKWNTLIASQGSQRFKRALTGQQYKSCSSVKLKLL